MEGKKHFQIADILHGSIQISRLEKQIISTHAFNRLHNILQNSTVYLTFPTNQTKRFAHSLGVLNLGGEMFQYSILNAEEEVRKDFFDSINNEVRKMINETSFKRTLRDRVGQYLKEDDINDFENSMPSDPLYLSKIPTCIKPNHHFAYCLVYQSVRCAALLHDVGHPPFSHITEYAMKNVYDEIIKIDAQKQTSRHRKFMSIIENYITPKGKIDLHEKIGNRISDRLLEHLLRQDKETITTKQDAQQHLFYLLVNNITSYILEDKKLENGEPSIFANMHRIVDGSIDCDRLDYVTRDSISSISDRGKIEYDRLINSMKLMKESNSFVFCFDLRTLSSIEDFFNKRWQLYKYIIYHHRVIKTDSLLGKTIVTLSLDYLKEDNEDTPQLNKKTLPLDISGLWRAIEELFSDDDYFNALVQWDDSWLLTVLRQNYFSKYFSSNEVIKNQLEELLSNKKNYISVIKRMDDFYEIDNSVVHVLKQNQDSLNSLNTIINELELPSLKLVQRIKSQIELFSVGDKFKTIPTEGFLLSNLLLLCEALSIVNIEQILNETINDEISKSELNDSIISFKKLKTGLEKSPLIHYNNKVVSLSNISNIENEFDQNRSLFPVFFLYLCGDIDNMPKFRKDLGVALGNRIIELFQEISTQLQDKLQKA